MIDMITHFLQSRKIDSFQKLRILLFMYQYPHLAKNCQELAEQLYLGETPLLESVLNDLRQVGLLKEKGECCSLCDDPEVRASLQDLSKIYNDPVSRQKLLKQFNNQPVYGLYRQPVPNDVEDYGD